MSRLHSAKFIKTVSAILILVCCFVLAGCNEDAKSDMKDKEKGAQEYYNDKYGVNEKVEEANLCENDSGFVGYVPNGDYYYEMSDGSHVMYLSESDSYVDNRQYEEIEKAIADEVWIPATEKLEADSQAQEIQWNGVRFGCHECDSYEGKGFATLYKGNIDKFIKKERPVMTLDSGKMVTSTESDADLLDEFCKWAGETFTPYPAFDVVCVSPDCQEEYPSFEKEGCYCEFMLNSSGSHVYKAVYISLGDGIEVTSGLKDFQLQEGDVTLVPVDTSEIQSRIDDAYNDTGDDQNLVSRDTLLEGQAYKIKISQRVKDAAKDDYVSCYFRVSEDVLAQDNVLYYYPTQKNKKFSIMYGICNSTEPVGYHGISENDYYFLGKIQRDE